MVPGRDVVRVRPPAVAVGRLTDHIGPGVLSARFDRDLLEEILNCTGRREKRSRWLPAPTVVCRRLLPGVDLRWGLSAQRRRHLLDQAHAGSEVPAEQHPAGQRCSAGPSNCVLISVLAHPGSSAFAVTPLSAQRRASP